MIAALRRWWYLDGGPDDAPLEGDTPAWLVSLLVNMTLMIGLALVPLDRPRADVALDLVSNDPIVEKPIEDELQPKEFYFSPTPEEKIGANSVGGQEAALAEAPIVADESVIPEPQVEPVDAVNVDAVRVQEDVAVATGPNFNENVTVRGAAVGVGSTGAVGAIDRITHEILRSLEERKTLVVWMFDATLSLQDQRAAILQRFDRIYRELGVVEASGNPAFKRHDDKPLLTAVASFGKDVQFLTPKPTDRLEEIKAAVLAIGSDEGGTEYIFSAVQRCAERYRNYRAQQPVRNVMLVMFTDEAGDDDVPQVVDPAVALCRRYEMPVYVVGVPAPFGRREVLMKYVDPDPKFDQSVQWLPVRQGPESYQPEVVRIGAADLNAEDAIDSGFGPFSLTRLCYETGGLYFAVHPNRNVNREVSKAETAVLSTRLARFFDPAIMRNYRPDYVSLREYERLLAQNKAKAALVQASAQEPPGTLEKPRTHFPKRDEANLAQLLSTAQQAAAVLEPRILKLYNLLRDGEHDRPKLTELRWQAGYDLAMGRVLAAKVRTEGYNVMLAKAKGLRFKNPGSDTWDLRPAREVGTGSSHEKEAALAKVYLERVAKEHQGTPWAVLAQAELKEPLGWKWEESHTGVNAPRPAPPSNAAAPPPRDDRRQMLKKPPPKRPAPKL